MCPKSLISFKSLVHFKDCIGIYLILPAHRYFHIMKYKATPEDIPKHQHDLVI